MRKNLLLLLFCVLMSLPTLARDFEYTYEGQTIKYTVIDEEAKTCMTKEAIVTQDGYVTEYGNMISGSLILPAYPKDGDTEYKLTQIGYVSFGFCGELTSVSIPSTVNMIDFGAFYECNKLTSAEIPNSVTSIGSFAFYDCRKLQSIVIPSFVTYMGEGAFSDCNGLVRSAYPTTVSNPFTEGYSIGYDPESVIFEDGFIYSKDKTAVYFAPMDLAGEYMTPETVTYIGDYAYFGCKNLTSFVIKPSVIETGKYIFYRCDSVKKAAYPNTLKSPPIEPKAFRMKYNPVGANVKDGFVFAENNTEIIFAPLSLKGNYEIPQTITSIGYYAFYGCKEMTMVDIPNSVKSIGDGAFNYCIGLTSVEIPNSVTSIGQSAFRGCSGLTSVVIPNSVTSIGSSAFNGCSGLIKSAYPNNIENPFNTGLAVAYNPEGAVIEDGWVWGPEKSAIRFAPYDIEGEYTIPETVTSIGSGAFSGCSGLTSVVIPNLVTSIGDQAFSGCSGLTSVVIPNLVTSIGEDAFSNCSGLTSVIIPSSVTSIGSYAFSGCSGLTSVIIPSSVTSIGEDAFHGCEGLKKSTYPNTLKRPIYYGIVIAYDPEIAIIENGFVWGQEKSAIYFAPYDIEGVYTIPETVTSIGQSAFGGCSGLTSVIIGNSVTSIGASAFSDCSGLKKSTYPNNLKNPFPNGIAVGYDPEGAIIEDGWVWGPEKSAIRFVPFDLEGEYTIPETVTYIGSGAFEGCSGLNSVKCQTTDPAEMNDDAFKGLYDTTVLCVSDEAVGNYLATNWSLFKNMRTNTGVEPGYYSDGVLEYRLNPTDMTATVIGANSFDNLQIPERFTDDSDSTNPVRYNIKGIGYKAFAGKSVKTVEFNSRSKMEIVGDYAFQGTNITTITLPTTVKAIGDYAFENCSGLTDAILPDGLETLGKNAFTATAIRSIEIPESVKTIGDYAFYNTSKLSNVILHEGLESIGIRAFSADKKRSVYGKAFYLPSTVKSIGYYAFDNFVCSQVDISDLTAWCLIDFGSYDSNPLWAADNGLFVNGEKLTILKIPDGIKSIKPNAFCNCKTLVKILIPEGIEKIGTNSFYGCSNVSSWTIPSSVTKIGDYVFGQKEVKFSDGLLPISIGEKSFYNGVTNLTWGRPIESLTFDVKNLTDLTIGSLIEEIPEGKFNGCANLRTLTLGSEVQTIGANAFSGCNSLTDVKFGSNIAAIGDGAFSGCTKLTEVVLPPAVETIGAEAFAGNSKMASIIMGHNVKTIGEKAFDGCPASTVSITAQTPPTAPNNTFSVYSGKLYLQGQKAVDAYYDAYTCWDRFSSFVMIDAEKIQIEGADKISGKAGDTFQLTATVWPENVTLPQVFWRSTNPEIATVDANGLVTLHVDLESLKTRAQGEGDIEGLCTIIAETLYNDGPIAQIGVTAEDNTPVLVNSLTIDPTVWSGEEGSEFKITATVLPEDATDKTLTWTSSDETVATVDSEGNVKVLKEGNCTITVATTDGSNLTAECVITSLSGVEGIFGEDAVVDVYDMNGVLVKRACARGELKELLTPGVYVLRSGNATVKAVIR